MVQVLWYFKKIANENMEGSICYLHFHSGKPKDYELIQV
jgi:hypothetical protein